MKTLYQGKPMAPWWVGKQLTCSTCGCRVELETTDSQLPALKISQQRVHMECPNCGRENIEALNTSDFLKPPEAAQPTGQA